MTVSLNDRIHKIRPGPVMNWEHNTDLALSLLEEITQSTGRQWDIFLEYDNGQVLYEITNAFMIDEDGEVLLIAGWTGNEMLIDVKAETLASAACLAWLAYHNDQAPA